MSVIEQLLDLQSQDEVVKDLERQVHDIPKRRKIEQDRLDDIQRELQHAKESVASFEKRAAQTELDISELQALADKYDRQRQTVQSQQEYNALGRQADAAKRAKAEKEQFLERAREAIDTAKENVKIVEARWEEESGAAEAYVASLRTRLLEVQRRLVDAQAARDAKLAEISTPENSRFVSYYERLCKKTFPVVVRVDAGGACPGCHMVLPPSKVQDAQRNAKLADTPAKMNVVACDYCGRLVFK
ncbi:MAG: hypothetical protein IJ783_09440 [Kiritimatiellae bacterium]|nr:hypothetical protein [Kiritimatiellia bacterium]